MMLRRFFHSSVSQLNRIEAFDSLGWKENRTCAVAIFSREKKKKKELARLSLHTVSFWPENSGASQKLMQWRSPGPVGGGACTCTRRVEAVAPLVVDQENRKHARQGTVRIRATDPSTLGEHQCFDECGFSLHAHSEK
jgi:hypothetical protein